MKLQAFLFSLLFSSHEAFIVPMTKTTKSVLSMASQEPSIEALREAAAKARQEAERLRQELGQSTTTSKPAAPKIAPKPTVMDVAFAEDQTFDKFGSANLRTFPVGLPMLQSRLNITAAQLGLAESDEDVNLDDFKYATLFVTGGCTLTGIASLAFLPPNVGATVCYLVALIPVLFLAVGSTAPAAIAGAIKTIKGQGGDRDNIISAQERMLRHEAAHFCCGYWCGLPVQEYRVEDGDMCVEFSVAPGTERGEYTSTQVAALTVTALSGVLGEALTFGSVIPGSATQDLLQLEQQVFRRSENFLGAVAQQDLTRWGALTAGLLLRQNKEAYEKIVQAMERKASLRECIELLESS
ncbi:hypothetical protein FisN_15Hh301 [Fistulifera solaris]|uniref:Peptidase M41 domain-containing protein n=1 Tax=Fistulifera solaris TaxID=1519565 RepID=A0A1Z5JG07_FISSO|nr:hypothetical protein FisN_15Hh301 [Fistulifera solaris]|eukprot:GAX12822.1 hypothetical protein FisN_15Hh301 [Fistulifera solaris]